MSCNLDGQKIAKKLAGNIAKETKKAKNLLMEYNSTCVEISDSTPLVTIEDALSPTSSFWEFSQKRQQQCKDVPWNTQKDIIQATLLMKRCDEELELLPQEMRNVLQYWESYKCIISKRITELQNSNDCNTRFTSGSVCLLKKLLWEVEFSHSKAATAFSGTVTALTLVNSTDSEWSPFDDSDLESSESETDEDSDDY